MWTANCDYWFIKGRSQINVPNIVYIRWYNRVFTIFSSIKPSLKNWSSKFVVCWPVDFECWMCCLVQRQQLAYLISTLSDFIRGWSQFLSSIKPFICKIWNIWGTLSCDKLKLDNYLIWLLLWVSLTITFDIIIIFSRSPSQVRN